MIEMKKAYVLVLLVLAGIGVVGVYAHMNGVQLRSVSEVESHWEPPHNRSNFTIGGHGERIIQRSQGTDILPPYTDSNEFGGYKSHRVGVLQDFASNRPGEYISAQVTFNAPLTVAGFENFVKEHSIEIIGVEGNRTDGRHGVLAYFAFDELKGEYDSVYNTMVNGTGEELLKVQGDSKVLLVDLNLEGLHMGIRPGSLPENTADGRMPSGSSMDSDHQGRDQGMDDPEGS